jgi:hypothetical protein
VITTTNAAALVKGAAASPQPKVVKLEVTRPFCIAGVRQELGAALEVAEGLARELVSMGKAVRYVEKPAEAKPAARVQEKSK